MILEQGIETIKQAITLYKGDGYIIEIFLFLTVCMLLIAKKNSFEKIIAIYVLMAILILINPIVAVVLKKIALETVYWRTLWILPMGIVISYTCVKLLEIVKNKYLKFCLCFAMIVVIMLAGKQMMTDENFLDTENSYKIPEEVIVIADVILEDAGGEAQVVASDVVSTWIREYTPKIELIYGRGYIYGYEGWLSDPDYFRTMLNAERIDMKKLDEAVRVRGYKYIVLERYRTDMEDALQYGYELLYTTANYYVYVQL